MLRSRQRQAYPRQSIGIGRLASHDPARVGRGAETSGPQGRDRRCPCQISAPTPTAPKERPSFSRSSESSYEAMKTCRVLEAGQLDTSDTLASRAPARPVQ